MKPSFFKGAVSIDEFDTNDTDFEVVTFEEIYLHVRKGHDAMTPEKDHVPYYHIFSESPNSKKSYFVFKKDGFYFIKTIFKQELRAEYHKKPVN